MAELKTNPAANRNNKTWSSKDDAVLIQMVMAGKQSDEIAQILGRTINSILGRKSKLDATRKMGIRLKSIKGKEALAPRTLSTKPGRTRRIPIVKLKDDNSIQQELPFTPFEEIPVTSETVNQQKQIEITNGDFSTIAEIAKRTGTTIVVTFSGN
jgi:DNA-binding CsgD family transcriptional regulator